MYDGSKSCAQRTRVYRVVQRLQREAIARCLSPCRLLHTSCLSQCAIGYTDSTHNDSQFGVQFGLAGPAAARITHTSGAAACKLPFRVVKRRIGPAPSAEARPSSAVSSVPSPAPSSGDRYALALGHQRDKRSPTLKETLLISARGLPASCRTSRPCASGSCR